MKQENWNRNTEIVTLFLEEAEDTQHKAVVMQTITIGNEANDDDMRTVYWTAIRNMGKAIEGFPSFGGKPSSLTAEQEHNVSLVSAEVESAFAAIPTEYHATLLKVFVPHGRTGGSYANWDAYIENEVRIAKRNMMTAKKEGRWDLLDMSEDGVPQITPPAEKVSESEDGGSSDE